MKDEKVVKPVVSKDLEIPKFKPNIPDYMLKGMDNHNKYIIEQISKLSQQNEWQTDIVYKIYNYTKTINGKVVELEHFRQRLDMELELDQKWADREREAKKWKRYGIIAFLVLGYPIYLTVFNHVGLADILENLIKL